MSNPTSERIRTTLLDPETGPTKTTIDTDAWKATLRERFTAFHEWGDHIAEETRYPSIIARQLFIIPLLVLLLFAGTVVAIPGGDVLRDAVLGGIIDFIVEVLLEGSAKKVPGEDFAQLTLFALSTPVPPDALLPIADHSADSLGSAGSTQGEFGLQTVGVSSILWDDIVRINKTMQKLVLPALSLYFAYYIFLVGIDAIRASERDMAFFKGILTLGLVSINLELFGVLLGLVRAFTLIFISGPEVITNLLKGSFAAFASTTVALPVGGAAFMGLLAILALFLFTIFLVILLARIPMILGTAALFPIILTGYLFGDVFRPIEAVMDRIFGYVYPLMFVTIPAAAVIWMTSLIFGGIGFDGGIIRNLILTLMGIGTFFVGILIVIKSTSTGAKMVSGTKKAVGTAALIGGVAALGGGGGAMFRTGAMTMRYGKGAGFLSGLGEAYRESHSKISEAEAEAQRTGEGVGVDVRSPMDRLATWRHERQGNDRDEFLAMDMGEYEVAPDPDDAVELDPTMNAKHAKDLADVHANRGKIGDRMHEWKKLTEGDPDAPAEPSVQDLLETFPNDSIGDYFGNVELIEDEHTASLPEKELARIDPEMAADQAAEQAGIDSKPIRALIEEWQTRVEEQKGVENVGIPTVGQLSETFDKSIEDLYGNVEVVSDEEIGAQKRFAAAAYDAPHGDEKFVDTLASDFAEPIPGHEDVLERWVAQGEDREFSDATVGDIRNMVGGPIFEFDGETVYDPPEKPGLSVDSTGGLAADSLDDASVIRPTDTTPGTADSTSHTASGDGQSGAAESVFDSGEDEPLGAEVSKGWIGDPSAWISPDSTIDFKAENIMQSQRVFEDSLEFLSTQEGIRNKSFDQAIDDGWKFEGGRKATYKALTMAGRTDGTLGDYFEIFGGGGVRDFAASDLKDQGFGFGNDASMVFDANPDIGFGELMHHSAGPTVTDTPSSSEDSFAAFPDSKAERFAREGARGGEYVAPSWKQPELSASIHPDYEYYNGKTDTRTGDVSISGLPTTTVDASGPDHAGIAYHKTGSGTIESRAINHGEMDGYSDYVRLFQSVEHEQKAFVDTNISPTVLQNNWSRIDHPPDATAPGEVNGSISGAEIRNLLENVDRGTTVVLDRHAIGRTIEGEIGEVGPVDPEP